MTAPRLPFTKRFRSRVTNCKFGHRPTNDWGCGDLPAPWAEGDVVRLVGERHERLDGLTGDHFVVCAAFSVDEGDGWYFRVCDGDDTASDRLHVYRGADWMAPFELVDTADPEGLAVRERMLADGWKDPAPRLSLDHARSFEVPCRWRGSGVDVPAVVTVSRWEGSWWASVTPDGWATLWLGTEPQEPWGPWMTSGSPKRDHTFPSAQAAVDAAFATEQITRGDEG